MFFSCVLYDELNILLENITIKKYFISMLMIKKTSTPILVLLLFLFVTDAFSSEVKTSRSKPTDILINYQVIDPFSDELFSASELPFRTAAKSLFFYNRLCCKLQPYIKGTY